MCALERRFASQASPPGLWREVHVGAALDHATGGKQRFLVKRPADLYRAHRLDNVPAAGRRIDGQAIHLLDLKQGLLWPLARPVSLKNESLHVIQRFEPSVVLSTPVQDTAKGTVAHMRPKPGDVARMGEPAAPRWVVFPRYVADAEPHLSARPKADAMMELGRNAFNYPLLALTGFHVLRDLISRSDCLDFSYSRLDDAVAVFDGLAAQAAR